MAKSIGFGTTLKYEATPGAAPYANTVGQITSINGFSSEWGEAECTSFDSASAEREFVKTLLDRGDLSLSVYFDGTTGDSEQHLDLLAQHDAGTTLAWEITLPSSIGIITFEGWIKNMALQMELEECIGMDMTIRLTSLVAWPV